jgi:preprotein translocase subunit SecA
MAQRDPLNEYKSEAFELFQKLIALWHEQVIAQMMRIEVRFQPPPQPETPPMQLEHPEPEAVERLPFAALGEPLDMDGFEGPDVSVVSAPMAVATAERNPVDPSTWGKVGRNEACPCGSGKKFKHCHGQLA